MPLQARIVRLPMILTLITAVSGVIHRFLKMGIKDQAAI